MLTGVYAARLDKAMRFARDSLKRKNAAAAGLVELQITFTNPKLVRGNDKGLPSHEHTFVSLHIFVHV